MGWDLAAGRGQERSEGGGDLGHMYIHQQAPSNSGTLGGPSDHSRILSAGGYWVQGRGSDIVSVVSTDGGGCPTEGWASLLRRFT